MVEGPSSLTVLLCNGIARLEGGEHTGKQGGVRIASVERDPDFAHCHPDLCPDFEELQPDGAALCLRQLRARQRHAPQRLQQDISYRREVQPQL
jgi:hypothetical protein